MAFKVLAVVLAICVTQNTVLAGPLFFEEIYENDKSLAYKPYGLWQCTLLMPSAYTIVQEGRTLYAEFFALKIKIKMLNDNCERITTEDDKLKCLKNVQESLKPETDTFAGKVKAYVPKVTDLLVKFRDCLFD